MAHLSRALAHANPSPALPARLDGKIVNLYRLFMEVKSRGGFDVVTNNHHHHHYHQRCAYCSLTRDRSLTRVLVPCSLFLGPCSLVLFVTG